MRLRRCPATVCPRPSPLRRRRAGSPAPGEMAHTPVVGLRGASPTAAPGPGSSHPALGGDRDRPPAARHRMGRPRGGGRPRRRSCAGGADRDGGVRRSSRRGARQRRDRRRRHGPVAGVRGGCGGVDGGRRARRALEAAGHAATALGRERAPVRDRRPPRDGVRRADLRRLPLLELLERRHRHVELLADRPGDPSDDAGIGGGVALRRGRRQPDGPAAAGRGHPRGGVRRRSHHDTPAGAGPRHHHATGAGAGPGRHHGTDGR